MNQVFFVIGATLCYVGGFGIMIFLLGILTELCIEIWDEKFRKICVRFEVEPTDVLYYSQNRKDIETMFLKKTHSMAIHRQCSFRVVELPGMQRA